MSETNSTRTEWGVRLTWPDGYTEVRTHDRMTGRSYSRRDAEQVVDITAMDREDGRTRAVAEVVCRVLPEWRTLATTASADPAPGSTVLVEGQTGDGTPFFFETVELDPGLLPSADSDGKF